MGKRDKALPKCRPSRLPRDNLPSRKQDKALPKCRPSRMPRDSLPSRKQDKALPKCRPSRLPRDNLPSRKQDKALSNSRSRPPRMPPHSELHSPRAKIYHASATSKQFRCLEYFLFSCSPAKTCKNH